ncbi:hypothetical protein HMPREF6123_1122 [Oribacterium sinus F0268]|uniref:Uncharacterized protein n=1 Tax=Oribacterium sinus F0268 TaxID=585501 RepID=C2KXA3_9FIRM|nr:hypothetical protein HMPREF6123_1122 [Oribacterium sinus F0268]
MELQESTQIQLITDIKDKIKAAQYRALLNVNEKLNGTSVSIDTRQR